MKAGITITLDMSLLAKMEEDRKGEGQDRSEFIESLILDGYELRRQHMPNPPDRPLWLG